MSSRFSRSVLPVVVDDGSDSVLTTMPLSEATFSRTIRNQGKLHLHIDRQRSGSVLKSSVPTSFWLCGYDKSNAYPETTGHQECQILPSIQVATLAVVNHLAYRVEYQSDKDEQDSESCQHYR